MFVKETVFITGAGTSVHYGYPTGAGLLIKVREIADFLKSFYHAMLMCGYGNTPKYLVASFPAANHRDRYQSAFDEVTDLISRLDRADPLVIDYFLGQNLQLEKLGKLLIAWAVLYSESNSTIFGGNYIRHIVHQLALGCQQSNDLLKNKVQFITYNYDTTLENRIRTSLGGLSIFDTDDINMFCSSERFHHVYGAVNDGKSPKIDFSGIFTSLNSISSTVIKTIDVLDRVYAASESLLVIDPSSKAVEERLRDNLRQTVLSADLLVILGFGFDRVNIELLGLQSVRLNSPSIRKIYVTNYNDISRINQSIGRTFISDGSSLDSTRNIISDNTIIYKSIRDTEGALSMDFDLD